MKQALRITLNTIMSITIIGLGTAAGFTVYQACSSEDINNTPTMQNPQDKGMRGNRNNNNQMPNDGQQPPEMPDGEQPNNNQQPPEMPNNNSDDNSDSASDRRERRNNANANQSSIIETATTENDSENTSKDDQDNIGQEALNNPENIRAPEAKKDLLPYFIGTICETFGASVLLTYLVISRFNKYSIKELMTAKK